MITPQNAVTPPTPNAVLVPQIVISTRIVAGKLVSSVNITMQPAAVDGDGNWQAAGFPVSTSVPDIANPASDIVSLASELLALEASIIGVVNDLNAIRKLV